MSPNRNAQLFEGDEGRIEAVIREFERGWTADQAIDFDPFLARVSAGQFTLLVELAHIDLERRYKAGQQPRVENYLDRYPQLATDVEVAVGLIAAEFELQAESNNRPDVDDYVTRFGQYGDQVADRLRESFRHVDTHRVASESEDTCIGETPGPFDGAAPPTQIRDYRILRKLGSGGMGTVFLAHHQLLKRDVALKILAPHLARDEQAVNRFEREMQVVGGLRHDNVVQATDAGHDDEHHFLVMEYVQGQDVHSMVRDQGPLPIDVACEIARQTAVGLAHIGDQQMVHRDIKPSNLMLSEDGQVKILDLGLATLRNPVQGERELTTAGQILGTLSFMAPEQSRGAERVDIRADIYGLAATLYYMLCGRAPLDARDYETPFAQLAAIGRDQPRSITEQRPDTPPELADLITRCLAADPLDRTQTPLEMAETLRAIQQSLAADPNDIESIVSDSDSRAWGTGTWLAGLTGVLLLLGMVVFQIRTSSGTILVELADDVKDEIKVEFFNGTTRLVADQSNNWSLTLENGRWEVDLLGGDDRFDLSDKQVVIRRGNAEPPIVKVSLLRPAELTETAGKAAAGSYHDPHTSEPEPLDSLEAKQHQSYWAENVDRIRIGTLGVRLRPDDGALEILGTHSDDRIVVQAHNDSIVISDAEFPKASVQSIEVRSFGGNDTIENKTELPSTIFAGSGDDVIHGGNGRDLIVGGAGSDTIDGGAGDDVLHGGSQLIKTASPGTVEQLAYLQTMHGFKRVPDEDSLMGERGWQEKWFKDRNQAWHLVTPDGRIFQYLNGNRIPVAIVSRSVYQDLDLLVTATGGDAGDIIAGGKGDDTIEGGFGDDQIEGNEGADTIRGGAGEDTIEAGPGADIVRGGDGIDTVHGGSENDDIDGEGGSDTLFGDEGNDRISGGFSWDGDNVYGGVGNDILDGGRGNDLLLGGEGLDLIIPGGDDETDIVRDEDYVTTSGEFNAANGSSAPLTPEVDK